MILSESLVPDAVPPTPPPVLSATPWSGTGRTGITFTFPKLQVTNVATPASVMSSSSSLSAVPKRPTSVPTVLPSRSNLGNITQSLAAGQTVPRSPLLPLSSGLPEALSPIPIFDDSDPFADNGGIDWGTIDTDMLNSTIDLGSTVQQNTTRQEYDMLQKLLDGVATPEEMRAAESSMIVSDEVLKQAGLDFLHDDTKMDNTIFEFQDPPQGTVADDSIASFDGPHLLHSTMIDDSTSSPWDYPQLLRGNEDPEPELQQSSFTQPDATDILQEAVNSITGDDVDMEQGESSLPPPTPNLTGQSVPNSSFNSSRGQKRSRGRGASRGRAKSSNRNPSTHRDVSTEDTAKKAKTAEGSIPNYTSSTAGPSTPAGSSSRAPPKSPGGSGSNDPGKEDADFKTPRPPPKSGSGPKPRSKKTESPPPLPQLPCLQTLETCTESFPLVPFAPEEDSIQKSISDLVADARKAAPISLPGFSLNPADPGVTVHTNSKIAQAPASVVSPAANLDDSFVVQVSDFPGHKQEKVIDVTVSSKGAVSFMLLCKKREDKKWSLPPTQIFYDYVVLLEQETWNTGFEDIILWHNMCGAIGLLGLQASSLDRLLQFRLHITSRQYHGLLFATFPREGTTRWTEMTTILKANLRALHIDNLTDVIFRYNAKLGLRGHLQLDKSYDYPTGQRTKKGESKEGWRHALILGDSVFMDSIKPFPPSFPFRIGSSTIQLRGGERKKEELPPKKSTQGKRNFPSAPPPNTSRGKSGGPRPRPFPSSGSDRPAAWSQENKPSSPIHR